MQLVFEHDFDDNLLSTYSLAESTTTPTIQTTTVYQGTRAVRCNPSAGQCILLKTFTARNQLGVKIPIYRASAAAETPYFFNLYMNEGSGTNPALKIQLVGGNLVLRQMDTSFVDTTVDTYGTMATGTWYLIDLKVDATSNPWRADWMVNGVPQKGANIALAPGGGFNSFRAGCFAYAMTFDSYIDKIRITDTFSFVPDSIAEANNSSIIVHGRGAA